MGTEDVKVTAMNMYKYKEGLRLYKRWPCSNKDNDCLKLGCFARESGFFLQKPFIDRSCLGFQSFPDRSRKIVTNEIFQELRNITSILLV